MNVEQARAFLLKLPHVKETMQFGDNLVFWVGDKADGGKMFCLIDLSSGKHGVVSFAAGPERAAEMQEREDFFPAPYLARAHWIAARTWTAARNAEWEAILRNAHAVVWAKVPKRLQAVLAGEQPKAAAKAKKVAAKKKPTARR